MTRLMLTWIGVLALLISAPRDAGAAELVRLGGASTSVATRIDVPTKGAAPRQDSWTDAVRVSHVTPGTAAEPPRLRALSALGSASTEAPRRSGPTALLRVLPDARAPPA